MHRFFLIAAVALAGCRGSMATATDMVCDVDCWCPDAPLPTVTLSPTTVDFGAVPVGTSVSATLTVSNTGTTPSSTPFGGSFGPSIDGTPTFEGGPSAPFPGTTGTCRHPLQPGESCTVVFTFAPDKQFNYRGGILIYYVGGICGGFGGSGGGSQAPSLAAEITAQAI